jgi:hypothetical protein
MPPEDKIKLWWSPHELTLISREAKLIAKGIRTRSYRKSNKPTSYARVVRQVYMECSETGSTSRTTTYNLQQWHSLGHSRRGLELYSVPIPERVQAKESVLRHVVVSMQRYYLNEKSIVDHDSRAKLIRVASLCLFQGSSSLSSDHGGGGCHGSIGRVPNSICHDVSSHGHVWRQACSTFSSV